MAAEFVTWHKYRITNAGASAMPGAVAGEEAVSQDLYSQIEPSHQIRDTRKEENIGRNRRDD